MNHFKYRADIDGLRAVAVLAVLCFHAHLGCPGGYVGVDVFFLVSGYLITGLILKGLDAGQFKVLQFWERRVRRILPAVAVVLLACLAAGWLLLLPQDFKELGESVAAQGALASNIYFWMKSWTGCGYFDRAAEVQPLLHTWSLAVEEQFYLLFPFLLIAFQRFSRKSLVPGILLMGGVSFGLSICGSYWFPLANFYLLPTRAWELLLGALLAAMPAQRPVARWVREALGSVGLLAVLYTVFFYDRNTRFPGASALLPCVGAALMIWASGSSLTVVGKLLAKRPVVFIGLISYSLYLWHWPMLVFVKYWNYRPGEIPASQRLLILLASGVLAVLSWKFVETPFRKRVIFKRRSQIFSFACATTAVLLLAGLALYRMQGIPSRMPAEAVRYANGTSDRAFLNEVGVKAALKGDFVELGTGDKDLPIRLLVWGDSHAMATLPVLDLLCTEHSVRGVAATHSSTAPLVGYEAHGRYAFKQGRAFNNAVATFIRSQHVPDVLLVALWDSYVTDGETARIRSGLLDTIASLKGSGARIWILRQVPQTRWDVPHVLAAAVLHGDDPEAFGLPLAEEREAHRLQDPIFEGLAAASGVTILDPTDLFVSPRNLCRVAEGGRALYRDSNHLTIAGAMVLRPIFEPIFGGSGKSPSLLGRDEGVRH